MFDNPASTPPVWATWPAAGPVPYRPRPVAAGAPWNRLAIVSLVLAVPGLYLGVFLIPQVAAIALGAVAHQRITTTGQRGRRLAIAGMIIGCVELVLWVLLLVAVVALSSGPGPGSPVLG